MIDLDGLSMAELEMLQERIHERLKLMDNMRAHQSMMAHNLGDKVCFDAGQRGYQVGTLSKFNRKPEAAGRCTFAEQKFAQKKVNSQGIPCLLLVEAGRIGSIEGVFKGFTRF